MKVAGQNPFSRNGQVALVRWNHSHGRMEPRSPVALEEELAVVGDHLTIRRAG